MAGFSLGLGILWLGNNTARIVATSTIRTVFLCFLPVLLLHLAGPGVQDLFDTLPDKGNTFDEARTALNNYFSIRKNITKERQAFIAAEPNEGEAITNFITRLRALAESCEYGEEKDYQVRDRALQYITDKNLRRKLLTEDDLTLEKLIGTVSSYDDTEATTLRSNTAVVSRISQKHGQRQSRARPTSTPTSTFKGKCWRCGKTGHISKNCEASRNHKCEKCGYMGHFEVCCHTKTKREEPRGRSHSHRPPRKARVHAVTEETEAGDDSDEYVFVVKETSTSASLSFAVKVDNVSVTMLADTGSRINIIDEPTLRKIPNWNKQLKPTQKRVYAYKSNTPLDLLGVFQATIESNEKYVVGNIYVVRGEGENLLSCGTALELGLITVTNMLQEHKDLKVKFPELFKGVGLLKDHKVKLHINPDVSPVAQKHRRIPFHLRKQVEAELQSLLDQDVIEPVTGPTPWVSPIVVVPKPKAPGKVRICVDMRAANTAIMRERHISPTLDDIVEQLNGSTVFSKIDLRSGYHQLQIEEECRQITTFSTHKGLFRYKRLNFGISSASEIFQKTIAQVLSGIPGALNISDDIIIHGKSQNDHDEALDRVCTSLVSKGLTANAEKCEFNKDVLDYYGFVFREGGMTPDPKKVLAIQELEAPSNPGEVRSFLGMVGYVSRFIPNYSTITAPLRELVCKSAPWAWEKRHQDAVDNLKLALKSAPVLAYFDPNKDTEIAVDASPVGLGAVLTQVDANGDRRVVAYASRSLSGTEQRYSQTEREALGVVYSLEHFHLYVFGKPVTVITDHKPLLYIMNNPVSKPPARIERWALRINPYNPTIVYSPGKDNPADYMSRHPCTGVTTHREEKVAEEYINFVAEHATPKAVRLEEVKAATESDAVLQKVIDYMRHGTWYRHKVDPVSNADVQDIKSYHAIRDELTVNDEGNLILRGTRLVIPKALQERIINIAHEGHQGIVKTKALLREKVWFPGIDVKVENKVSGCMPCQLATPSVAKEPLKMTPLPQSAFDEISIDFASVDGETLLLIVDDFSRYPIVEIVSSTSASATIPKLHENFALFGIPSIVKSDNGPPFNGSEFKAFASVMGFQHRKITPLWPQANGEVERFVKTLKKAVKSAKAGGGNWRKELQAFLMSYRTTPHRTTGVAPSSLMFGRTPRNKLPCLNTIDPQRHDAELHDKLMKDKQKEYADRKVYVKPSAIEVGDTVIVRRDNPNLQKSETPYQRDTLTVAHKKGSMVTAENGSRSITRNTSFFKKVPSDQDVPGDRSTSVQDDGSEPENIMPNEPITPSIVNAETKTVISPRPQRAVRKPRRLIEEY